MDGARPVDERRVLSDPLPTLRAMTTPDACRWQALTALLADAVRALPADGTVHVLLPQARLSLTWLTPERLLLTLRGSPPARTLRRRGWSGGRGSWHKLEQAAGPEEVVGVARDVLLVRPDDVELRRSCVPESSPTQGALW